MPRNALQTAVLLLLVAFGSARAARAQSDSASGSPPIDEAEAPPALVRSVQVVTGAGGPALEIITTRPVVPVITLLADPPRLVVDLPKSYLIERQRIRFRDAEIKRVRVGQFKKKPPIVRMVLDLYKPCGYGWDEAGNRMMVRIRPQQQPATPAPNPVSAQGIAPALAPASALSSRAVVVAENRLAPGSAVTAGAETTVVNLTRGGEVRVCPGTTVSVTPSQNGHDLLLAMNTGSFETHYRLEASADSILTPDFRILLAGPGQFDYAISADSRGNTCVRALPGNTASAAVSELMGDGAYQVKPSEEVVFRAGHLSYLDANVPADCGCPAASGTLMRAAAVAPADSATDPTLSTSTPQVQIDAPTVAPAALGTIPVTAPESPSTPETASLPASKPTDIHIRVDAPLVFRASDPETAPAPPVEAKEPPPNGTQHSEPLAATSQPARPSEAPSSAQPPHHGFFRRVKSVLAAIFR